jgi:hypothetical protein
MENLTQAIESAKKVMTANGLDFATIWETKTRKSVNYGFNFDKKEIGFSVKEYGVRRTVVNII